MAATGAPSALGPDAAHYRALSAASASHYDENILLFATEHTEQPAAVNHSHNNDYFANTNHYYYAKQRHQPATPAELHQGRFVSNYPSRPAQLYASAYQFHVPFHLPSSRRGQASTLGRPAQPPPPPVLSSPTTASASAPNARATLDPRRSRTMTNLSSHNHYQQHPNQHQPHYDYERELDYHHYGRQFVSQRVRSPADQPALQQQQQQQQQQQRLKSALRVSQTCEFLGRRSHELDNPFRPGTELSWEAELMVRLMLRGYPVAELPALVRAAKHAAARSSAGSPQPAVSAAATSEPHTLERHQSIGARLDAAGKQAWANSLSGAQKSRSVPHGSLVARRADSIERLIASIELELEPQLAQPGARSPELDASAGTGASHQATTARLQAGLGGRTQPSSAAAATAAAAQRRRPTDLRATKRAGRKCCVLQ